MIEPIPLISDFSKRRLRKMGLRAVYPKPNLSKPAPCLSIVTILVTVLVAPSAWALAGFSERSSEVRYADGITLQWNHPADGCDPGTYCFYLAGLPGSLEQINVPTSRHPSLAFARRQRDKAWLIVDLPSRRVVLETSDEAVALAEWRRREQTDPVWANAADQESKFSRTWRSVLENSCQTALIIFMFFGWPILLIAVGPFVIWKVARAYRAYQKGQTTVRSVVGWAIPATVWLLLLCRAWWPFVKDFGR